MRFRQRAHGGEEGGALIARPCPLQQLEVVYQTVNPSIAPFEEDGKEHGIQVMSNPHG